jgi:AsmA-like C-terminal region
MIRWICATLLLIVVAGALMANWALKNAEPMLRRRVVQTLSARFNSPVELDSLHIAFKNGVLVTGSGLRILYLAGPTKPDANPGAPPMLTVENFDFTTGLRELLRPTTRVVAVNVQGMQIRIPPRPKQASPDNPKRRGQPRWGIAVDKIICTDTKVVLETNKPGKDPLVFNIGSLILKDVGQKKPFNYDAVLVNPKPVGDIHSTGHFGPWQNDNPRDTPLDGSYQFTHVDLSTIKGISGTLSSTGRFAGTLGNITADGVTDTPNFSLDLSNHPVPLHAEFHAIVDGTTGDTTLQPVHAQVLHSTITASGAVTRTPGIPGHHISLDVVIEKGRIEDMLALGVKMTPPLMRGALTSKTHLDIPQGTASVSKKVRMNGTFEIHGATFNNQSMQQKLDALSKRAQGKPNEANSKEAEVVASTMAGSFSLANAILQVNSLDYQMPGAQLQLDGQYSLASTIFEFHGTVRTEATASQMTTGWKSMLLQPFDSLLKKKGAGLEVPIKITGDHSTYDIHLDFGHEKPHIPPHSDNHPK